MTNIDALLAGTHGRGCASRERQKCGKDETEVAADPDQQKY